MSDRITRANLEGVARVINTAAGINPDLPEWSEDDSSEGLYYIDGAYGGFALYRVAGRGATDVLRAGHIPARDLWNRMRAFLDGFEAAREEE